MRRGPWLVLVSSVVCGLLLIAVGQSSPDRTLAAPAAPDLSGYPWLYLSDGRLPAPTENVTELITVGDMMLGRGVAGEARPLEDVTPWLRTADVAFGNLECVVAKGGTLRPGPYRLRAPLSAASELRDAGFDVVSLANNHALDAGPAGLEETAARLGAAGIALVGGGPDRAMAAQPLYREIGGVRLAFVAFNAVHDPQDGEHRGGWARADWDREVATAAIAAARARADAVIVSVHWGYEYELHVDPAQRAAADAMLAAGADLIVGHHPHVAQVTELVVRDAADGPEPARVKLVAYSLGNFLFDQEQDDTQQGLALRVFIDRQGLRAVQLLPVRAGLRPWLMSLDEAAPLLKRVTAPHGAMVPARDLDTCRQAFVCHAPLGTDGGGCEPVDSAPTARFEPFKSGFVDLTGDGVSEEVRLTGDQVAVYSDGAEVWRGLPEWRVVDLALGDPNDDGRGEMVLALWKHGDEAGTAETSHPFVVGYRGGTYRVLWGGSAVSEPIFEVELGDVDGDGVQELVLLEGQADGLARTVSVWRWHGWGFSLLWRSAPGRYRDLALLPGMSGSATISFAAPCAARSD